MVWPKIKKISYVLSEICTETFILTEFITAQTWKQPVYSSVGERIHKLWYFQAAFPGSTKKKSYEFIKRHERNLELY